MEVSHVHTILIVDDAKDTLTLLEFDLIEEGYKVETASSGEQALQILQNQVIDLVLLDLHMPKMSGLDVLQIIKENPQRHLPVIMLSTADDEDEIVQALDLGADDYVSKPYIAKVLFARIRMSLRLIEKQQKLEQLIRTDSLTRVNNRVGYEELSLKAISHAKRNNHTMSVAMLDIDFFKVVNDEYGHDEGDTVLVEFAALLMSCFREYDVIGRIGGEEFAICMPNTDIDYAYQACERFRQELEQLSIYISDEQSLTITVSIGVSSELADDINLDELMREADKLMYQAKASGRNQTVADNTVADVNVNKRENVEITMSSTMNSGGEYPGIDYSVGVNNVLGDDDLFKEILIMFYQDHGQDEEKIGKAIADNDLLSVKSLVHTLKGVACSIGAMNLFEQAKALDVAANEQKVQEFDYLFKPMAAELNLVLAGIKDKLSL